MATFRYFQTNFTAGEFSPRLEGRVDIARYANAAKTVRNYHILTHGGVMRRPGTKFVAEVKDSTKKVGLVAFEFSTTQAYIIEFGDKYLRFYKDSGQILGGTVAYEIATPYAEADLFNLKMTQSADTLYIVHESYAPRKLTRTGHTNWTLTVISFVDGPYLDELSDITFTPSAVTGNSVTLTASAAFFDTSSPSKHIDALIRLKHALTPGGPTVTPQGTTGSTSYSYRITSVDLAGESLWGIAGTTTTGNATLSRTNYNRITWTSVPGAKAYRIYGRDANSHLFMAEVPSDQTTFDDMATVTPGSAPPKKDTTDTWGYAQITAVASATSATVRTKTDFGRTTASSAYREGAWSTKRGFPQTVSFHEDRIVYGGAPAIPQRLDGSESGLYDTFTPGTKDDAAFAFTIASNQVNISRWLASGRWLLIGTVGGEFRAGASDEDPITPSNFNVKSETPWGSSRVAPARIGNVILFVQRGGRKLREFSFVFENDAFTAPDLTLLAEHLFPMGKTIVQMAFQREPDSMLWLVRSDGLMCNMVYDRTQDVVGWHQHVTGPLQDLTDGAFESVAVIPHPDGDRDQVWVSVKRTVNGATKRFVEFFEDAGVFYEDQHVDSGLTYDGEKAIALTLGAKTGTNILFTATGAFAAGDVNKEIRELNSTGGGMATIKTFTDADNVRCDITADFSATSIASTKWGIAVFSVTGLAHLNGEKVRVVGDGAVYDDGTVAGGSLTLAPAIAASKIEIGLAYNSKLETLRPDVQSAAGTIQGFIKRVPEITVRFYKTLGATINGEVMEFRKAGDKMDQPPGLLTGDDRRMNLGFDRNALITVEQTQALPSSVIAIVSTVEIADR